MWLAQLGHGENDEVDDHIGLAVLKEPEDRSCELEDFFLLYLVHLPEVGLLLRPGEQVIEEKLASALQHKSGRFDEEGVADLARFLV